MKADNTDIGFLFDLDGVLIDSEKGYTVIWEGIDRKFPTGVLDFARKIKGCTLEKILAEYFPGQDIREKVVEELYRLEAEMTYEPKEGTTAFLEDMARHGVKAVIVTSSNDKKMQHLWRDLPGLRHCFHGIIDGDMVEASKPDPEGYLKGAAMLGAAPGRCVVFEDSLQGVMAGHRAGSYVVGVAGTLPAETIAPYCDIVVNSLADIDIEHLITELKTRQF